MLYEVELTTVAEDAYVALYDEAEDRYRAGQLIHPAVLTFEEVQQAMTLTLPADPYKPGWPMAGDLSWLHVLNLNSVTIIYVIADEPTQIPKVIIQRICKRKKDGSMRRWLSSIIDSGAMNPVLHSLGIEPPLYKVAVNSRLVH
jgi:hypothetical protein